MSKSPGWPPNYTERQWWRSNKVPSMLLEIPEQDLAAAIGCLALGTLCALRSRSVPRKTGEVLSWRIKRPLRGKVPPLLIDALNGMDEIRVFEHPGYEQQRIDMIDELISRIEWILQNQAHGIYDMGWMEDPAPGESDAMRGETSGETRFPYPVDDEQILRAVGSSFSAQSGNESERWVTFEEIMGRLGRADAAQVKAHVARLLYLEWLEEAPAGDRWRPTESGWKQYHYEKRISRPGLWD